MQKAEQAQCPLPEPHGPKDFSVHVCSAGWQGAITYSICPFHHHLQSFPPFKVELCRTVRPVRPSEYQSTVHLGPKAQMYIGALHTGTLRQVASITQYSYCGRQTNANNDSQPGRYNDCHSKMLLDLTRAQSKQHMQRERQTHRSTHPLHI